MCDVSVFLLSVMGKNYYGDASCAHTVAGYCPFTGLIETVTLGSTSDNVLSSPNHLGRTLPPEHLTCCSSPSSIRPKRISASSSLPSVSSSVWLSVKNTTSLEPPTSTSLFHSWTFFFLRRHPWRFFPPVPTCLHTPFHLFFTVSTLLDHWPCV